MNNIDNEKINSKNNILICANSSWNIFNFRYNLIYALIKNNFNVIILSPRDRFTEKLVNIGCKFHEINFNKSNIGFFNNLLLIYRYFIIIKKLKPNLILTYTIKPNLFVSIITKILKIKIYNIITGLGSSFLGNFFIKKLIILLYKFSLSKSNLIIFQNQDDKNMFIKYDILKDQKNEVIKGSGVNTIYYSYYEINKKSKETNFLFIGRIIKDKGIYELITAFKKILSKYNNINLYILGDIDINNPSKILLSEINQWENDKIINYIGYKEDIRKYIKLSDCIILPSYREGLPKSLLQASSCGRPMISTDVPGCKEVVKDNYNGFLCMKKNSHDLYLKIEKFINSKLEDRIQMGINARDHVIKNFDEKIIIDKYLRHII